MLLAVTTFNALHRYVAVMLSTGDPNLGYMHLCLSEGAHLRLAIEGKNIFIYHSFANNYAYISGYYFQKSYNYCLNISSISHDHMFGKKSIKRVSIMLWFGTHLHSPRL